MTAVTYLYDGLFQAADGRQSAATFGGTLTFWLLPPAYVFDPTHTRDIITAAAVYPTVDDYNAGHGIYGTALYQSTSNGMMSLMIGGQDGGPEAISEPMSATYRYLYVQNYNDDSAVACIDFGETLTANGVLHISGELLRYTWIPG